MTWTLNRKSYHAPEQVPVTKIHIHFFFQFINVALSQDTAIYICLKKYN